MQKNTEDRQTEIYLSYPDTKGSGDVWFKRELEWKRKREKIGWIPKLISIAFSLANMWRLSHLIK